MSTQSGRFISYQDQTWLCSAVAARRDVNRLTVTCKTPPEPQNPLFSKSFWGGGTWGEVGNIYRCNTLRRTLLLRATHKPWTDPACSERLVNRRLLCRALPLEAPAVAVCLAKAGRDNIAPEILQMVTSLRKAVMVLTSYGVQPTRDNSLAQSPSTITYVLG